MTLHQLFGVCSAAASLTSVYLFVRGGPRRLFVFWALTSAVFGLAISVSVYFGH
jgi:hypothetical protein